MITRHQLISILLKEMELDESMRVFIAIQPDNVILSNSGYKCIRRGYYI